MSAEQTEEEEVLEKGQTAEKVPAGTQEGGGTRSYRRPGFAVLRALVVLAIAAVGYQEVVPVTHVDRTRLVRLAVGQPGVKQLDVKPANAGAQPAAQSGLSVLAAEARKSPNRTGLYAIEWVGNTATTSKEAAEEVTFLSPDQAGARRLYAQLASSSLSPKAESSSGLTRLSTFTVAGVPGASGSLYGTATKTGSTPDLAGAAFRYGNVVALTEGVAAGSTRTDVETITRVEYGHLRSVEPGFSLSVVDRPVLATALWAAGAVLLAIFAALGPPALGRLRRRRDRRRQEELDRIVRGHAITKRRRTQGP